MTNDGTVSDGSFWIPTQDVKMVAGWLPVTREFLEDASDASSLVEQAMRATTETIDRFLRPWLFPDPNPMPKFVPFPWVETMVGRLVSFRDRFRRDNDDWDDDW